MKTLIQISTTKKGAEMAKSLGLTVSNGSYFGSFNIDIETGESEVFIEMLKELGASFEVKEAVN